MGLHVEFRTRKAFVKVAHVERIIDSLFQKELQGEQRNLLNLFTKIFVDQCLYSLMVKHVLYSLMILLKWCGYFLWSKNGDGDVKQADQDYQKESHQWSSQHRVHHSTQLAHVKAICQEISPTWFLHLNANIM